jgi:uncharacterized protein YecT (DUF1311 family)
MLLRSAFPIFAISLLLSATPLAGDPAMECNTNGGSQVDIRRCLGDVEKNVDLALEIALEFAMDAATELDNVTGRAVAVSALQAGQAAWSDYRDKHCEYVGSTFGGGSGTGIAIRSCRIELARTRTDQLMRYTQ